MACRRFAPASLLGVLLSSVACSGGVLHHVQDSDGVEGGDEPAPWPELPSGSGWPTDASSDDGEANDDGASSDGGTDETAGGEACPESPAPGAPAVECGTAQPGEPLAVHVAWAWVAPGGGQSAATPMVARLTDDNGDGVVDGCDPPDVVVLVHRDLNDLSARLWILDGATGLAHRELPFDVSPVVTPALVDLDGDGASEIVAQRASPEERSPLIAIASDGQLVWEGDEATTAPGAIAVVDLASDGSPEILHGPAAFDARGDLLWDAGSLEPTPLPTAADLDGDGTPEVLHGATARAADGSVRWQLDIAAGHSVVAQLDDDDAPEVAMLTGDGIAVIEHDGTPKFVGRVPAGVTLSSGWQPPLTVADLDGDGPAELMLGVDDQLIAMDREATLLWSLPIDGTTHGAPTAFDLDGDGALEVIYGSRDRIHIVDANGVPQVEPTPRVWEVGFDNPIVVDLDDDGSAEIVVPSGATSGPATFTLQALDSAGTPWQGTRGIWNQHAYHVTNVEDDGSIPQVGLPYWRSYNRVRANVRVDGSDLCLR